MGFTLLGSFPNSQIRPRAVTEDESTVNVDLTANISEQVTGADTNRTALTILNEGATNIRLRTADEANPTATEGFLLVAGAAIEWQATEAINGFSIGGAGRLSLQIGVG